jgi:hypothetical protein
MNRLLFALAFMVTLSTVLAVSQPSMMKSAAIPAHAEVTFPVGNYTCSFPSANNSSYSLGAAGPYSPALGYQIWHDGLTWPDLYATSFSRTALATTNDFAQNVTYYGPGSNAFPPTGAVITAVGLVAIFSHPQDRLPSGYSMVTDWRMAFSLETPPSWADAGAPIPVAWSSTLLGLECNITGMAAWTSAMLSSSNLSAKLTFTVPAGMTYYLDYLGFDIYFYVPPGIGTPVGGVYPNGTWEPEIYIPGDISTEMGFFGLIGLVIVTPIGIWVAKERDEKLIPLLGVLVFGAMSFGLMIQGFS